jgi:hypothetical protein
MSNSVSRFPESNASAVPATDSEESKQNLSTSAEAALKLVIDNAGAREFRNATASQASLRALQGPLDRIARQRVFEAIARKALENPSHPYYKVGPEARNEMIRAIADALDHSHYLKR